MEKSKIETELEKIEQQKMKLLDGLKTELAKTLSEASEKYKVLQRLGVKNALADPQFSEFVNCLGISVPAESPLTERPSSRSGGMTVQAAMLEVLKDGKAYNIAAIKTAVEALKGIEVSQASINGGLHVLKQEKKLRSTSRGLYQIA